MASNFLHSRAQSFARRETFRPWPSPFWSTPGLSAVDGQLHRLGRGDGDGGCGGALASLPRQVPVPVHDAAVRRRCQDAHPPVWAGGVRGRRGDPQGVCVNRVAKRLGTALRKLSTQRRKRGVTLGGRGFGKLTATTMVKLTGYYGKAIWSHAHNLQGMSDAVFATFDHAVSTDEKPQHTLCPQGADSWCFHQRALALGETPGTHRADVGIPLSAEVGAEVHEVYERLGHRDLLRRCLHGATQNANECLHSKVRAKCPKTSFVGYQRAVIATSAVVAELNGGIELSLRRMYGVMGIVSGERLVMSAVKTDGRRLLQSQHQVTASTREARRAKRVAKARSQDTGTEYSAGAFRFWTIVVVLKLNYCCIIFLHWLIVIY